MLFFLFKKMQIAPHELDSMEGSKTALNSWEPVFKVSSESLVASSLAMLIYFLQQDNPYELKYASQDTTTCDSAQ